MLRFAVATKAEEVTAGTTNHDGHCEILGKV